MSSFHLTFYHWYIGDYLVVFQTIMQAQSFMLWTIQRARVSRHMIYNHMAQDEKR